jgi:hypothetical protein
MPAKRKPAKVWVVMHYEILGLKGRTRVDSMQFHVSSSRRKAEEYVRGIWVSPYSWWQVHPYVVDDVNWLYEGEEVYYYSHRGKPLRTAPSKQAMRAWVREQDRGTKDRKPEKKKL